MEFSEKTQKRIDFYLEKLSELTKNRDRIMSNTEMDEMPFNPLTYKQKQFLEDMKNLSRVNTEIINTENRLNEIIESSKNEQNVNIQKIAA